MRVTKIKMKPGCYFSSNLAEIDQLFIVGCKNPGYYKKAVVHDHVKAHPGSITVDRAPFPAVIPAISITNEKYVRSSPNGYTHDNLLDLPRERG